jgi:hypothetical protein
MGGSRQPDPLDGGLADRSNNAKAVSAKTVVPPSRTGKRRRNL